MKEEPSLCINKVKTSHINSNKSRNYVGDTGRCTFDPSYSVHKQVPLKSVKKQRVMASPTSRVPRVHEYKHNRGIPQVQEELKAPVNRAAIKSCHTKKEEDIEALVDVDRRTIVFEKHPSDIVMENSEIDLSHPLHQITWYNNTSIEDIESAIDEVVEIMEEMKQQKLVLPNSY